MEKECTCRKIVKKDKVTLIWECDLCKKNRRKELKLCIELVDKLIELKKLENQNPTIVNIRDIKGKTFQDILDELKPNDIINSIKEQIKEPVKSRFQQKLEEAMKQSLEYKEKK